jgi:hypothetical protein
MRALFVAVKGRGIAKEEELTVQGVRGWHISPSANPKMCVSDYVKRFKLGLSQTVGTIVLPRGSITVQEDWVATEDVSRAVGADSGVGAGAGAGRRARPATKGGAGAVDAEEKALMVMTEGCGFISTQAMKEVAHRLGLRSETPSAIQARIGAAKGLWIRWDEHGEQAGTETTDGRTKKRTGSNQKRGAGRGAGGCSVECAEEEEGEDDEDDEIDDKKTGGGWCFGRARSSTIFLVTHRTSSSGRWKCASTRVRTIIALRR